ncbi:MAG: hypothetical protein D6675_13700 [Gemmatimonadetes bacterium]|nr:MAG: hypothetical protein D6675_13700 [Gemmatimonadota bacterium]
MFDPKEAINTFMSQENLQEAYPMASFFIHAHSGTVVRRGPFDIISLEPLDDGYHIKLYILDEAEIPANPLARNPLYYNKVLEARRAADIIRKGPFDFVIKGQDERKQKLHANDIKAITAYQLLYSAKKKKASIGETTTI